MCNPYENLTQAQKDIGKTKMIDEFVEKDYGLFLDTENDLAAISVNKKDGCILFHECCYYGYDGAFQDIDDWDKFDVIKDGDLWAIAIVSDMDKDGYVVGRTKDYDAAREWVDKCNKIKGDKCV